MHFAYEELVLSFKKHDCQSKEGIFVWLRQILSLYKQIVNLKKKKNKGICSKVFRFFVPLKIPKGLGEKKRFIEVQNRIIAAAYM